VKKHFVTFLSPGTLVSESTIKEIESWDTSKAVEMSKKIKERHAATPYGFYFSTRERGEKDLDSKQTEQSGTYYLGGEVLTLKQVKAKKDPNDRILISNMECNNWDKIVINKNSWKVTQPLRDGDVVI